MTQADCFLLGWITKPRSFKGEVIAHLDVDRPEAYLEMESVFVEINGNLVPFFIETIARQKAKQVRIKFEDVDSEQEAKDLVKKQLYLPLDQMAQPDEEEQLFEEIIGYLVIDEQEGELGELIDIFDNSAHKVFEVEHDSGREILIPFSNETILAIDQENREILVNCPEGLIDLYLD